MKNIELNKLLVLLARAGIPFEVFPYSLCGKYYFQICYPDKENCVVDAVSTPYTYGGKNGLIEVMVGHWKDDDVHGWLTANEAFQFFDKANGG